MKLEKNEALEIFKEQVCVLRMNGFFQYSKDKLKLTSLLDNLKIAIENFDWPIEITEGNYPLLIVVSTSMVPINCVAATEVFCFGSVFDRPECDTFSEVCCVFDIDRGFKNKGETEKQAMERINKAKRLPLTISQGLALGVQYLNCTSCDYHIMLLGSYFKRGRHDDELVPFMLAGVGRFPLFKCTPSNKPGHKHFGVASRSILVIKPQ